MKAIVLLLLLACGCCRVAATSTLVVAAGEWSTPVVDSGGYGLRGRLLIRETPQHRGPEGCHTAVYLELQEWSDFVGQTMQVYCNMEGDMAHAPDFKRIQKAGCRWELRDGFGKRVEESPFGFSGAGPGTDWVTLPCDSSVRLRASLFGGGRLEDGSLGIALPSHYWVIPSRSTNEYFLSATFTVNPPTNSFSPLVYHVWHGTLTLPKMKIPVRRP
jgi:hypothetical protein